MKSTPFVAASLRHLEAALAALDAAVKDPNAEAAAGLLREDASGRWQQALTEPDRPQASFRTQASSGRRALWPEGAILR